jgi:hypothetical protein
MNRVSKTKKVREKEAGEKSLTFEGRNLLGKIIQGGFWECSCARETVSVKFCGRQSRYKRN